MVVLLAGANERVTRVPHSVLGYPGSKQPIARSQSGFACASYDMLIQV